jgi:hypothetical protein
VCDWLLLASTGGSKEEPRPPGSQPLTRPLLHAAVRSCWLTVDLGCSLRRLADGDRIGNKEPATFNPYTRGRY